MAGESITFDFVGRGASQLGGDFRKVGDNAALAAKGARLCADALDKQRKAAATSVGATLALAKADQLLADAEEELSGRAALADAALRGQGDAAKKAGKDAGEAAGGFGALAGGGGIPGGGMGAAIAAGAVLSPVLVTLGTGLAGFGLAAAGVAKPIEKAAQKTGGLRANLKSLDPEQQAVARSILGLGREYDQFQKALQPEVLNVFNQGIKLAGGLLHDVQPVAQATGKALGVMLGQVDREFRSGTWKQFFGFMADTAGTDVKLLTGNFTDLLNILPPLLEDLQPLAQGFLEASDNALKLAGSIANFGKSTDKTSNSVGTNTGLLGFLAKAVENVTSFMKPGGVAAGAFKTAMDGIPGSAGKAGASMGAVAVHAQTLAGQLNADRAAVDALTASENKALSPLLAYSNALIAQHNDANSLATALKASHDRIGLQTDAERASFGAAQTYIQDLLTTASAAVKSHQGIDAQIRSIQGALPALQNVKGGTKAYWQEVQTLVGWLNKLKLIKAITEAIHVNASGVWTVTPGKIGLPGGSAGGPFALGGRVTGGTPGRDSVLGMLMPGEVVVPTAMVQAGAVDHLRGSLPGFATGGVVGSYGPGAVSGLPRWMAMETNATVSAVARSTASALVAGINAARASQAAGAGIRSTALGGDEGANRALARSMFPWPASMWPAYVNLEMAEAGFNRFARNPSSGAYGIPQALPPTKMPFAAQAAGGSHAGPQLSWMFNYIRGRYGNPVIADNHELAYHWYAKGGRVPGYASGGSVASKGRAWLNAWQNRSGGGYGAAWGPVVVNEQIARMKAAIGRAQALSGAKGLSAGQHRFWAAAAADEKKRLAVLRSELATERAWRTQLGLNELALDKEIRAAGNLKSLAGPVKEWKAALAKDKATVSAISAMLGYSDAYIKAHPAAPKLPPVQHVYGGDVADIIAPILASALAPVTMDSGGWLRPGLNGPIWNGTGRPEAVVPASRGGAGGGWDGTVQLEITGGDQELVTLLRKIVRVKGGGNVQAALGSR